MSVAARISRPFRYLAAMAALAALVTGCASTPPPTASAAGSPASAEELRKLGDFAKKAQDEGWVPQVRGGRVLYCVDETPLNSRLPEKTCLDQTGLEQRMLADQRQRESMQRPFASACPQPGACTPSP
jgi:hypothetical protein